MKKKIIFLLSTQIFSSMLFAQQLLLIDFNKGREHISKTGIKILATYSATNIIFGSIAARQASGSNKYFHEMNACPSCTIIFRLWKSRNIKCLLPVWVR